MTKLTSVIFKKNSESAHLNTLPVANVISWFPLKLLANTLTSYRLVLSFSEQRWRLITSSAETACLCGLAKLTLTGSPIWDGEKPWGLLYYQVSKHQGQKKLAHRSKFPLRPSDPRCGEISQQWPVQLLTFFLTFSAFLFTSSPIPTGVFDL